MPSDSNTIDKVKAGTEAHPDRVFAHVGQWTTVGDAAKIKMSDNSEWIFVGEEHIQKHAPLLDLSRDKKKPLLLAVDKTARQVGMIFSTMTGVPEFYGETADGRQLQVSVPPSMRVFRVPKDRPWFDEVKAAIKNGRELEWAVTEQGEKVEVST